MKKIITFVAVAVVLIASGKAFSQQIESWKGVEWECAMDGGIEVTGETPDVEYLSLLLPHPDYAGFLLAYHCTDGFTDFRSDSTPWIEVSFEDLYPDVNSSIQLWIRDACPPAATYFMTQIGTDAQNGDNTYLIIWRNPNTGQSVMFNTAEERSAGVHTLRVVKTENGAVEYFIDDKWLWSTEEIPDEYTYQAPEYFGNIILMAQFATATFTDYKFGNGYSPEPSSLAVDIDIRPFSDNNKINQGWGVVPVAILSNKDFDAPRMVDRDSLTFGRTGKERSKAFCLGRGKDVNNDGINDLIAFFRAKPAGFEVGDTVGHLKGTTLKGEAIAGRDSVHIEKKNWWRLWRSHKWK